MEGIDLRDLDLADFLDVVYFRLTENLGEDEQRKLDTELERIPVSAAKRDKELARKAYEEKMKAFWAAGAALG